MLAVLHCDNQSTLTESVFIINAWIYIYYFSYRLLLLVNSSHVMQHTSIECTNRDNVEERGDRVDAIQIGGTLA